MSKLLKSKFLLGVMIVAVMVVGFAVASKASAATCDLGTVTLRQGSTGDAVKCLQTTLGITADGKFGPMTKAKVMAFQSDKGLTADGVVGAKTKAAMAGVVTTEELCPNGNTLASNCTTAPSTTPTQALCPNGMTLASNCTTAPGTTTTTSTGTNGYLVDLASDSTNRVSTVYESEQGKIVAGFRATARLADQSVDRVRVTFDNTNSANSSANLSRYISGASLWNGSTKIATIPVAQADRNTSTDVYTFNFTGLNSKILKDQIGRFYVSVDANGSIDSNDTDATWRVIFVAGGVNASSPDGTYDTYPTSDISTTGLGFAKFSSNGVKVTVGLASGNPPAGVVTVNATNNTTDVTLLKFTVKATNSDLTLRKIPIQVTSTTGTVSSMINTIKLYQGSNIVDTLDGGAVCDISGGHIDTTDCTTINGTTTLGYLFSNLSDPYNKVTSGQTVEYTIVADLKKADGVNYSAGDSLTAKLLNADVLLANDFSVQDVNGDQLTNNSSTYRVGSAVGEIQTLLVNGVNTVMGATSITTVTDGGLVKQVTYTIPVTVTAIGDTRYVGLTVEKSTSAISGTNAFRYVLQNSDAPTTDLQTGTATTTLSTTDATLESGTGYRLDSGIAKHFTIKVIMSAGTTSGKAIRVALKEVQTSAAANIGSPTAQTLLPVQNFQTDYQIINQ